MDEKKLYLIDGYAFAYRAYYALIRSPLVNSKGFPTGAVYGFANYLLRLLDAYSCPYLAVAMDSRTPTFRHRAYEPYKANREAMPDDLKLQMPVIGELLDAFNIPVVRQDGFEADDVIATLTRRAVSDGFDVFLVTKDKDLMQLVGKNVRMLAPESAGVFNIMGPSEVSEKMGVRPDQILDYLSMVGDASDNIPGVPGIGPKNAVKILETLTVDRIIEDPSLLESPKMVSRFTEFREQLILSKKLATLRFDVELDFGMDHLAYRPVDMPRSHKLLKELEFTSMLKHPLLGGGVKFEPAVQSVDNLGQLRGIVNKIKEIGEVAIDMAADGALSRAAVLTGITLAVGPSEAFHVPLGGGEDINNSDNGFIDNDLFGSSGEAGLGGTDRAEALKILAEVIESEQVKKIGHDLKFCTQVLRCEGLVLQGVTFDTLLAAYTVDPGKRQNELSDLVRDYLGLDIKAVKGGRRGQPVPGVPSSNEYAACAILLLRDKFQPLIDEKNCRNLFNDIELPLSPVLVDMEWDGVLVDTELLSSLSREYGDELARITGEIYALAGGEEFNLNSPKQVAAVLFDKLGLHAGKGTKSGSKSTSVDVLEKLADDHPIAGKILEYREKQKLLSTYVDALLHQILPGTGRVHTSFNQAVTATGRLSSTNPNLQNIPIRTESGRKIREAFIAPPGCVVVSADYSQIELRILAHLSSDSVLVQAFIDDRDIHTQTAASVYNMFPEMVTPEMRRAAKTINFGLMYGMGPINLSKQLGVSFADAKRFIEAYFDQFPSIRKYIDSSMQSAHDLGYAETLLGRKRYLPEINSSNRMIREAAERTAINTPVQGTAADIIKIAMIRVHGKMGQWPGAKMLLQVHDELVFEVPEGIAVDFARWVSGEMGSAYQLKVPLKVEAGVGRHWGAAH
ncbi:MAG: DNA polymerase I [Chitinispirillia bacterium]|nr:DNA polymerase I [Chitinispirillia bacterium]MCL2268469.1 DNA polymerase I [Chitinispirillia bacterium]